RRRAAPWDDRRGDAAPSASRNASVCLPRRRGRLRSAVGTASCGLPAHVLLVLLTGSGARVRTSTQDSKGPCAAITPPPKRDHGSRERCVRPLQSCAVTD